MPRVSLKMIRFFMLPKNKTLTPVSGGTVYDVTLLGSNLKRVIRSILECLTAIRKGGGVAVFGRQMGKA